MLCKKGLKLTSGLVPCGQCMNCRINKQRQWASRIMMEWTTHGHESYFVTLTYDDEHIPRTAEGVPTLHKKGFTKWLGNTGLVAAGLRYYAVGEYGENTTRPHLHLALFPKSYSQLQQFTAQWQRGFTSSYEMSENRALYLAKYTTKKLSTDSDVRLESGQEPEFRTSSRRPPIGAAFIPVLVQAYSSAGGRKVLDRRGDVERSIRFGRKVLPIPRYILSRVRERLGIPRLHEERLAHDGYYERHCQEEYAEWKPDESLAEEIQHAAKKKALSLRGAKL